MENEFSCQEIVKVGDIIRAETLSATHLCEVSRIEVGRVFSLPSEKSYEYSIIVAAYRFDGTDFKCIWEREDYKERKTK